MSTKQKNNKINKNLSIGNILLFGNLDVTLSIKLEKSDLFTNKINFNDINSLEDALFLTQDQSLWPKFELIANNELMKILIESNKIFNKKNTIVYLIYDKLNYDENTNKFAPLLDYVLFDNGFIIQSYEIVPCQIRVEINLIYNKNQKSFMLFNKEVKSENQDNEEGSVEENNKEFQENEKIQGKENEENDDEGNFSKIPVEEINFNNFKYIYFHLDDYINDGEFSKSLNVKNLITFIKKLKKKSKIKIIINIGNNFPESEDDFFMLLKISDIHIIKNKNIVLNILKNKKQATDEIEEKNKEREILEMEESKRISKEQKKNKTQNNSKQSGCNSVYNKSIYKKTHRTNLSQTNRYQIKNKNKWMDFDLISYNDSNFFNSSNNTNSNILFSIKNKSIDKSNMFIYMRQLLYNDNISKDNKLGIYIDEFNKIYFVDYSKNNVATNVTEYNMQLYPKLNVHSIDEIEKIKNFLKVNEMKYYHIYIGSLLGAIVNNNYIEENNYYLIYSICNICLEKILVYEINEYDPPKNKDFYTVKIKKEEINKSIQEKNIKIKEQGFNNNIFQIGFKKNLYNPLLDKYSQSFLQSSVHFKNIKSNELINQQGYVLYDPVYKEIFGKEPFNFKTNQDKEFYNFIQKSNNKKLELKGKDYFNEYLKKKSEIRYKLPGINCRPEYYLYYNGKSPFKKSFLPKIRKNKSQPELIATNRKAVENKNKEKIQKIKIEVKDKQKNEEEVIFNNSLGTERNFDGNREVNFQPTPQI